MPCCEKRVLVTGGTGLIGKETIAPLLASGYEVHAVAFDDPAPIPSVNWIRGSLFDDDFICRTMSETKPTHLLNLAWATTGDYLTSSVNEKFLHAGEVLAEAFAGNGGRRAVYAGTCFEYAFKDSPISECDELDAGKYPYTQCKDRLRRSAAAIFAGASVSFGYGRVFFVYGRGESPTRLTGMVVDKLDKNERVVIKGGPLRRDYVYSKDVAGAFVSLLDSPVEGAVNICTGRTVSIRDYVMAIANAAGKPESVEFHDECDGLPAVVAGDPSRLLKEVGYVFQYDIGSAIREILEYRREGGCAAG